MEARDQGTTVTDPGGRLAAFGNQLIEVHVWLREQLDALRDDAADGHPRPRELRAHCLAFCTALTRHHSGEDDDAFRRLAEHLPELRPVLDELRRDHRIVADALRRLDEAVARADPAELRREVDGVAALMETHFGYEERRIVAALNALDVPEWRRSRPAFLRTDGSGGGEL